MSLHEFLKILRQRWWVILLCTLIAAVAMFIVTPARGDTTQRIGSYTATTTLLVGYRADPQPPAGRTAQPVAPVERASMGRIQLFITTGEVPKRAAERLNYTGDPAVLATSLTVTPDPSSESITISTTAADGQRAADVANVFAEEAVAYFQESPPGAGSADLSILQVATPIPNRSTEGFVIPPDRNIRTALAALVGLLFGLALALVLDRLDSRLRTRVEIADALDIPVISEVPRLKRNERGHGTILTLTKPLSVYADGYRAARTALMHMPRDQAGAAEQPQRARSSSAAPSALVVVVTSAHAAEGKTTSTANLAASFAETGQRVLVLDADLRSPDTHNKFGVPQGAGISDYVASPGSLELVDIMRPTNVEGVRMITAGTRLDYPASLTSRLAPLIEDARRSADVVLVDTSPLLAASDVFDILPLTDAIVLVVRAGRLTENAATRVSELLARFRVPVTGAIVIGGHMRKADYGYGEGDGKRKKGGRRAATEASITPRTDAWDQEPSPRRSHE